MATNIVQLNKFTTYKGKYNIPRYSLPEFMQELEDMEVWDDDIFIASYPKSGTNWMQEIVLLILVDGHVNEVNSDDRRQPIEIADIASPTPEILAAAGPTLRQMANAPSPRVLNTHVPPSLLPKQIPQKGCKVIYVYRNPKDVINSDYNFSRKLLEKECGIIAPDTPENFDNFFRQSVNGMISYGSWFDHVLLYSKEKNNYQYFFVSYEDMKKDLEKVVKQLASFIGHPLNDEAVQRVIQGASLVTMRNSLAKSKEKKRQGGNNNVFDPTIFINKGTVNQWKHRFTVEQNEYFDKIFQEKMSNCELAKQYGYDMF